MYCVKNAYKKANKLVDHRYYKPNEKGEKLLLLFVNKVAH